MTQESIKALAEKEYPGEKTVEFLQRVAFEKGAILAVEENKLVQALNAIVNLQFTDGNPLVAIEALKAIARQTLSSLELKPPASEPDDEIKRLERVIEIKEAERKEWAELCIRKQAVIESLNMDMFRVQENMLLGNIEASNKIVLAAINNLKNYL